MKKLLVLLLLLPSFLRAQQPFLHPGINQSAADMAYMKSMVLSGKEPWKTAYRRMMDNLDTAYNVTAYTHVMRGPYGKPNIGGVDLSKTAGLAYDYALAWYITHDQKYAQECRKLLKAWSDKLWDFDYNDAKLMVAWTGHQLCNAAEILKFTDAAWPAAEEAAFKKMLLSVYYPVIKDYFPTANGNWDGAMIHTLIAIAVFMDDHTLFDNAVQHYLHGPVNGSLCRYVYPNGQCQESLRDQGHVQLGLGEFAGAAHVALTQGTNLFEIADNRILLGFEYTAGYLLGKQVQCYGKISDRAMRFSDFYEPVIQYAQSRGMQLPNTFAAADSVRLTSSRSLLAFTRKPMQATPVKAPIVSMVAYPAGAGTIAENNLTNALVLQPGDNIQEALDKAAATNASVLLKKGVYNITASLLIPSNTHLFGEGEETIIHIDQSSTTRDAIINATEDMHDVTLCNLVIDGMMKLDYGTDPNSSRSFKPSGSRGGIIFRSEHPGLFRHIALQNITVKNCTYAGVQIFGAEHVRIERCDFNENGSSVVPGPGLLHNLHITHSKNVSITNSRIVGAPFGCGLVVADCENVFADSCELARNAMYGLLVLNSFRVKLEHSLVEANDKGGCMIPCVYTPSRDISIYKNTIRCNGNAAITAYAVVDGSFADNIYNLNGNNKSQTIISTEKKYNW